MDPRFPTLLFASWRIGNLLAVPPPFRVRVYSSLTMDIEGKIESALAEIRPMLAWHRGGIEFVKFEEGTVYVRLLGTCHGCPLSQLTLKAGVEELLKEKVAGVKKVEAVD